MIIRSERQSTSKSAVVDDPRARCKSAGDGAASGLLPGSASSLHHFAAAVLVASCDGIRPDLPPRGGAGARAARTEWSGRVGEPGFPAPPLWDAEDKSTPIDVLDTARRLPQQKWRLIDSGHTAPRGRSSDIAESALSSAVAGIAERQES
ncbi:hypothetical protein OG885_09455 [Streptomyces sp. NBC_00028]|uniref:hypothetical protein n=1 Tax=Streptomyces sp. NBC_00028 TaxID=2975624 RepID=UPI00324FC0AE